MVLSKLILVARVAGAFGVKGEVRIVPFGDDPMALVRYRTLLDRDGRPALTLQTGRLHKGALVARAAEVSVKEAADAMRGLDLYAPRDAFAPPADDDEFYLADLIGLEAVDVDGRSVGRVKAVPNFGAGDLLEVQPTTGPVMVIPFTKVAVPAIDLAAGRITVVPPEFE